LEGETPKDVLDAELSFIDKIGLHQHLSPTRSNGLLAMIKRIKAYAMAFNAKA
jgi:cysteine desulfuration protein SufE